MVSTSQAMKAQARRLSQLSTLAVHLGASLHTTETAPSCIPEHRAAAVTAKILAGARKRPRSSPKTAEHTPQNAGTAPRTVAPAKKARA